MNELHRLSGIALVALMATACADQNITNESAPNDLSNQAPSFSAIAGAGVVVDFENPPYSAASVNGQDDWSSTGPYDQAVVANSGAPAVFGAQSLRISNATASGSFGDQTFSKRLTDAAGETTADDAGFDLGDGTRLNHFEAQWQVASTVPGAQQPGLSIVASPDRGDGSRMSWVQMLDGPKGLDVNFFDVQGNGNPANFVSSPVAKDLKRNVPHTIKITMDLLEGESNDVVKVYVDGALKKTGTSWENYYRFDAEATDGHHGLPPIVNRMLFRAGGTAAPATSGKGFLIDNLALKSSSPVATGTPCTFATMGHTMRLQADCTTSESIRIPDGFTLDGAHHTITAVNPASGHFVGPVVTNEGPTANVNFLNVRASSLAEVCDAGDDRLRGILFDGAKGSITNSSVVGINQGVSGCQEGNAIEVRNAPFDGTHPRTMAVKIDHNTVDAYQKGGIICNGDVDCMITRNTVGASNSQAVLAANSVQLGSGARGRISDNSIAGNTWCGAQDVEATAVLLVFAGPGVVVENNKIGGNSDVGIYAFMTTGAKINRNKVTDVGIDCTAQTDDIGIIWDGNTITKNTVTGFVTPYDPANPGGMNNVTNVIKLQKAHGSPA